MCVKKRRESSTDHEYNSRNECKLVWLLIEIEVEKTVPDYDSVAAVPEETTCEIPADARYLHDLFEASHHIHKALLPLKCLVFLHICKLLSARLANYNQSDYSNPDEEDSNRNIRIHPSESSDEYSHSVYQSGR